MLKVPFSVVHTNPLRLVPGQAARGVSSLSSNMSISAGEMSYAVAAVQTVITGGPDVSASASRVSSTLRLTLVDLASNISDVSSALKAYENNPSTTTASALRSAAGSAATVANTTAISFAAPLLNMQQVVTDLQLAVEKLDTLASSFVTSRSSMLSMLQALGTEIARYEMGLANLADVMGMVRRERVWLVGMLVLHTLGGSALA